MYLDLTCPVELLDYELSPDDHNKVRAYIRLNSTSDSQVALIEGEIYWSNSKTGRRALAMFIADQLVAKPDRPFKLQLSTEEMPGADGVEVIFTHVKFVDGGEEDWTLDRARLISIEPPLPPRGRELNMLLHACGNDAQNFPLQASEYWFCVCGRANGSEAHSCARCRRVRDEVMTKFTRKAVVGGETLPVYGPESSGEVPDFLYTESRSKRGERAAEVVAQLKAHRDRQRKVLVRRSVFVLVSVALFAAIIGAMDWLGDRQEQAQYMRVPTKVEAQ